MNMHAFYKNMPMKFLISKFQLLPLFFYALFLGQAYAQAQISGSQPSNATANQLIQTQQSPDGGLMLDAKSFSPSRIFSVPSTASSNNSVNYDLQQKPTDGNKPIQLQTTLQLNTSVESKLGGGGGGGGPGGPPPPPPAPAPPPAPRFAYEFPDLVQSTLGQPLAIFGADLFDGKDKILPALDPLTVPANYRVGPGDELLIRAWGQIDINFQSQIDRAGTIFLPKIGTIMVAGQTLADLRALISQTVSKQFKNFELTVTLGALRQIQFYVTGFAKNPGIRTTESTATAIHGLLASGGPTVSGDLRRIELRRDNQTVATIDAYKILIDGDQSADPQLLPGDVIYVPPAKGFVAIAGSVKRPFIYHFAELMTVSDGLRLAGGLNMTRTNAEIRLEHMINGRRSIENLSLERDGLKLMRDGDILVVLPASPKFENYITLRGNVATPFRQPWREGIKVSDVLNPKTGLIRPAAWMQRNVKGALSSLADLDRDTNFVRDFPDMNWDYASIERINPVTLESKFLTINLAKALLKDPENDLALESGDSIIVYAKADFKQPDFQKTRMVKVEGEVRVPGIYVAGIDDTIPQIIKRAGGLTERAYVFGTVFTRDSAKKEEESQLKEVVDRIEQDYLRYLASKARTGVTFDESTARATELDAIKELISRMRSVVPLGRIPLNFSNLSVKSDDIPSVNLQDLDTIYIPTKPATVAVVGSVYRQGSLLWQNDLSGQDYIANSGGFRNHANSSEVVVFRADGTVKQLGGWFATTPISPGDTILIPEDVSSPSWTRAFRDWSQIFYQLALGTAALKILKSSL